MRGRFIASILLKSARLECASRRSIGGAVPYATLYVINLDSLIAPDPWTGRPELLSYRLL